MLRTKLSFARLLTALLAVGCSERVTEPDTAIGLYRLATVQGVGVPAADAFAPYGSWVRSGDLVLRGDNRAFGVIRTNLAFPVLNFDKYRINGTQIEFTRRDSLVNSGTIAGDSIVLQLTLYNVYANGALPIMRTVVFRKSPGDPVEIRDGTYILTTVANQPISQQRLPGYVVDYDTIRFTDGVFYRRTRREQLRDAAGNEGLAGASYSLPGTYRGTSQYLLLGPYQDTLRTIAAPTRDSLIIQNGVLILRT